MASNGRTKWTSQRSNTLDRRVLKESVRIARSLQQRIELDYVR